MTREIEVISDKWLKPVRCSMNIDIQKSFKIVDNEKYLLVINT